MRHAPRVWASCRENENAHDGVLHAVPPCMKQPPELVGRAYRFSLAALRFYRKLPKSPDAQVPAFSSSKPPRRPGRTIVHHSEDVREQSSLRSSEQQSKNRTSSRLAGIHADGDIGSDSAPGRSERNLRNVDGVYERPTQLDVSPPFYFLLFTFYFHISSPLPRFAFSTDSARWAADRSCTGCRRTEDSRPC